MKDDRSSLQQVFIILFATYAISNIIHYFFEEVSLVPIFIGTAVVISVSCYVGKSTIVNIVINLAIALQMTSVLSFLLSNFMQLKPLLALSAVAISLFLLLSFLPLLFADEDYLSTISDSLLAASAPTTMLLLMKNHELLDILLLIYPVIVSCLYVILSSKVDDGFFILISNTTSSLGIAALLTVFTSNMNFFSTFSLYDMVLAVTWLSTIVMALLFNNIPKPVFQLGYQLFLEEKATIQKDIATLKQQLTNADQLSDEDLFHIINPLKSIHMEKVITKVLPSSVTRYNLQGKCREKNVTTWLLVFGAYLVYLGLSLYLSNAYHVSSLLLLLFGIIYCIITPIIISRYLYKNLIDYVNTAIIIPFNRLNEERNTLIKSIKSTLQERGFIYLTQEDFENVYSNMKEIPQTSLDSTSDFNAQNV